MPASAGIGLRAQHHLEVLSGAPRVAWFEAHSENYFADGGLHVESLMSIRAATRCRCTASSCPWAPPIRSIGCTCRICGVRSLASSPASSPSICPGARWAGWQFLKSGYINITNWQNTLYLFENEYHTPVLSPHVAALTGTFGELFFPTVLVLAFAGRLSAIGLLAVNVMAVISYRQVLLAEGCEVALGQHVLWGSLLLFLIIYGPGKLSLGYLLNRSRF